MVIIKLENNLAFAFWNEIYIVMKKYLQCKIRHRVLFYIFYLSISMGNFMKSFVTTLILLTATSLSYASAYYNEIKRIKALDDNFIQVRTEKLKPVQQEKI